MQTLRWQDDLSGLETLQGKEAAALHSAGIIRVADLLLRVPRRYENRRVTGSIAELSLEGPQCLRVKVVSCGWKFSYKRYFEAVVESPEQEASARLYLRWFHMPYIAKLLAEGQLIYIYGTAKNYKGMLCMINPDFEIMEDDSGLRLAEQALGGSWEGVDSPPAAADGTTPRVCIHVDRWVPIYRNISGVAARRYREIIWDSLERLEKNLPAPYYDIAPSYAWRQALLDIHFPEQEELIRKARLRLALNECFVQQFKVQWRRRRAQKMKGQISYSTRYFLDELIASLPYSMTGAQQRCLGEIMEDMAQPIPMNRLVQGDVGSGKTLVALAAMLLCVESGKVAALIAPTQILAEQHYENFSRLLAGMDIAISLRTADRKEDSDIMDLQEERDSTTPRIVVGTHALLYKKNRLSHLGLAVIDEQHKFGVEQRARFISTEEVPDLLVMTATPIPRTLTLTLYGDLDVSVIDEFPANRGKILTALRHPKQKKRIIKFLHEQLEEGRQIYIVSPLVEESEKRAQKAALSEWEHWKEEFSAYEVGLLHGKLSAEEKEDIMRRFRSNEVQVLVATTVVEVGVDVANATVMMINDADSFGLSQLHQLRGRIGRGEHKSYCILLSDAKEGDEAWEKLSILVRSRDGFEIAEEDFRLRGPGDVLGKAQSGLGSVQFVEWLSNSRLIHRATREVVAILDADPQLERAEHAALRELVAAEDAGGVVA